VLGAASGLTLVACGSSGGSSHATASTGTSAPADAGSSSATGGASGTVLGPTSEVPVGGGMIFTSQKVVATQPTAGTFKAFRRVPRSRLPDLVIQEIWTWLTAQDALTSLIAHAVDAADRRGLRPGRPRPNPASSAVPPPEWRTFPLRTGTSTPRSSQPEPLGQGHHRTSRPQPSFSSSNTKRIFGGA